MAQWSVPLDRLVDKAKADMQTACRKIAFEAFKRVVEKSPVRSGRFRANWNASYASPNVSVSSSTNTARGLEEASKALEFEVGSVWYFTNALPYAERLEYGYSKQAPGGMVRLTLVEITAMLSHGRLGS